MPRIRTTAVRGVSPVSDASRAGDVEPPFCYLTTRGRRTGRPHTIEIWFTQAGATAYLISGGSDRSDWVRNLFVEPTATLRVGEVEAAVSARLPLASGDERERAVRALFAKYGDQASAGLDEWLSEGYIVALDREGAGE